MSVPPGTLKTFTPDGVVGIVEPQTLGLTSGTCDIVTGFLQSAINTIMTKVEINGQNPVKPVFS